MTVQQIRDNMINKLRSRRPDQLALIDEYVAEAEHQEGLGYWLDFDSIAELLIDFDMYSKAALDADD